MRQFKKRKIEKHDDMKKLAIKKKKRKETVKYSTKTSTTPIRCSNSPRLTEFFL